jgi:hypothetical protein
MYLDAEKSTDNARIAGIINVAFSPDQTWAKARIPAATTPRY